MTESEQNRRHDCRSTKPKPSFSRNLVSSHVSFRDNLFILGMRFFVYTRTLRQHAHRSCWLKLGYRSHLCVNTLLLDSAFRNSSTEPLFAFSTRNPNSGADRFARLTVGVSPALLFATDSTNHCGTRQKTNSPPFTIIIQSW